MIIRRSVLCAAAVVVTLTLAPFATTAGAHRARGASAPIDITIGTSGRALPATLPLEVAVAEGFFADQGLNVEIVEVSGAVLPTAVASGDVNATVNSAFDMARLRASDINLQIASGLAPQVDLQLVAAPDSPLVGQVETLGYKKFLASFEGLTIGVPAVNGPTALTLIALLEKSGLSEGDYTLLEVGGTTAFAAIASGQVDVAQLGGGVADIADGLGISKTVLDFVIDIPKIFGKQFFVGIGITEELAKAEPTVAKNLQLAMTKAIKFAQDPANAARLLEIQQGAGTPPVDTLGDIIAKYSEIFDSGISVKGVKASIKWAVDSGIIEEGFSPNVLIAKGVKKS